MTKGEMAYLLKDDLKNKTDNDLVVYAKEGNEEA